MDNKTLRERLDAYTKEKYGIDPEILPFSRENYDIYRHTETGKWFAVFIVKDRSANAARSSPLSYAEENAGELWDASLRLAGLQ